MDRWEIEEMILGMADIVYENRQLRKELKEMSEYKRKYHELIDMNVKEVTDYVGEYLMKHGGRI